MWRVLPGTLPAAESRFHKPGSRSTTRARTRGSLSAWAPRESCAVVVACSRCASVWRPGGVARVLVVGNAMRTAHVIRGIVPSVARSRAHSSARLPNRMPKSRAPTTSQQIAGLWAAAEGKPPPQRKHNNNKPQANATTKEKRTARKHFDPQKTNAAFERCYSRLVPADEWQEFLSALRRPLPTTFSFVGTGCASVSPLLVQREFEAVVATLGERASRGPGSDGGARHFHSTSAPTSSPH